LAKHSSRLTREKTFRILLDAYQQSGEILKAAELKATMGDSVAPRPIPVKHQS
jgi:hypothetical protein